MKTVAYWLEMACAPVFIALILWDHPQFQIWDGAWTFLGYTSYTFLEFGFHKWGLHDLRLGTHYKHHNNPEQKIYEINYGVSIVALVCWWIAPMFAVGLIGGYWWYLVVHHCVHHQRNLVTKTLLSHHDGHHKLSRYNFGVSTVFWDELFSTRWGR